MQTTVLDLAHLVDGDLHGDATVVISGAATVSNAGPEDITLADNDEFLNKIDTSQAAAVVVPHGVRPHRVPYICVDDVRRSFAKIVLSFRRPIKWEGIGVSPDAHVSPSARIAPDVDIYPGALVGDNATIGSGSVIHSGVRIMAGSKLAENVILFPNVVLYENTIVGPRVTIHSGAVIGAYGFGYDLVNERHELTAQLGHVEIKADVEIGACTTIDRGTYDATVIGEGTKIDNLVMIAHNCRIGRHNIICSQVGIAGSVTSGDYAVFAGQVGVKDHVHIGDRASLGAKSGIMSDVPAGSEYLGAPAMPLKEQWQAYAIIPRLPEMRKQVMQLERELAELKKQIEPSKHQGAA